MNASTHGSSPAAPRIPDLPRAVTSFGAAIQADTLYVCGGHFGKAHHYYHEGQSGELLSFTPGLDTQWQLLGTGVRLQGLALVQVKDRLLRLGGFEARNPQDEEQDLWSTSLTAVWNHGECAWSDTGHPQEARSSFDAGVLQQRVYVVGGWKLQGSRDARWCETAEVGQWDEAEQTFVWQSIAAPPFQRRALSVACCGSQVFAIGGMQPDGQVTPATAIYDPARDQWSEGPPLPGGDMAGFGTAAATVGDKLYVSTSEGQLLQLDSQRSGWESIRALQSARFFHQILPLGKSFLALIGGANMETGKFASTEVVPLER